MLMGHWKFDEGQGDVAVDSSDYANDGELADALFYLLLTFSNALFLSWLSVKIVGRRLLAAYDRVQASGHKNRYDGRYTRGFASVLFWYLPDHLRAQFRELRAVANR